MAPTMAKVQINTKGEALVIPDLFSLFQNEAY